MPLYTFQKNSKIKDFFFNSSEVVSIGATVDIEGETWTRIPVNPNVQIDSIEKININDPKKFAEVTGKKKGTVGSLFDLSKELSEKRAERNGGEDPVAKEFEKNHAKKRKGKKVLNKGNIED